MEHPIFAQIPELRIMVCRRCQHGVHPREVEAHLRRKHYMKTAEIQPVLQAMQQWRDLIQDPAAVHIPRELDDLLPIIPVHATGMRRRRDPQCQDIGSCIKTMRKHWSKEHGWTQYPHRGHVTAEEKARGELELQQSYQRPDELPVPASDQQQIVAQIKAQAAADEREAASQVIQADELHDANPWLRMTRWARYLVDVHHQDLLDVVATPDPEKEDRMSRATCVLWNTMEQLARRSQRTVKHCGSGIRMAAVSTMPGQTPHMPLSAYMDEKSIQDHVRPWQQILLFIARTQADWPWRDRKPGYIMTTRQRKTWRKLWQLAVQAPPSPGDDNRRSSPDPMETEDDQMQLFIMSPIETACLEFCIELLNQKTKVHEYESALVCSMAVLGRGVQAWLGPESYPPIISRVLKVARFMIVQKALWRDPQPTV
ncbi:hypothetical protein BDV12DRAFT_204941 [Aspergillus spectabilis]